MSDPISTDPCVAANQLRTVYHALIMGKSVQTVEFQAGNGSSRRVTYTEANLAELKNEIARLDAQCRSASGGRPRRFGMRAGGVF